MMDIDAVISTDLQGEMPDFSQQLVGVRSYGTALHRDYEGVRAWRWDAHVEYLDGKGHGAFGRAWTKWGAGRKAEGWLDAQLPDRWFVTVPWWRRLR